MSSARYFERIFHPIGQGAFYSETHRVDEDSHSEINVVYDCGSKKNKAWVEQRVKNAFQDRKVELLFLSHFHDDHYKGIKYLKPKYIVLPLLNEWDKAIFWIGHELGKGKFDKDCERKLKTASRGSEFIYIEQMKEENIVGEEREPIKIGKDIPSNKRIQSGTPLYVPGYDDWIYIPINPKLSESIIEKFKSDFKEKKIDEKKILNLDTDYFNKNRTTIKKIYNKIGTPNEYSMVVYSGPKYQNSMLINTIPRNYLINTMPLNYYRLCWSLGICRHPLGCLYLGDINLKENQHIPSKILEKIYSCLPENIYENLSTIQVPHHGSIKNFNCALKSYYNKSKGSWCPWDKLMFYVISAGKNNRYGHPSKLVLKKLMKGNNSVSVYIVSESTTSIFIEKGIY